jgi:hypothetical protein
VKSDRVTLAFFIDALGWTLARDLDCFRSIAPHRYRQRTVLGYSCAAQPTILTGLPPAEHGHWAMFYRSEPSQLAPLARFAFLPPALAERGRVRRRILAWHRRRSGITGYYNLYRVPFPLFRCFDVSEKRDIYAAGAFDTGVESIVDVLEHRGIPYRAWSWKTPLGRALTELETAVTEGPRPRFVLFYTAVLDALLHGHVGDREIVAHDLGALEERITRIVELASESYASVDVLVFSDHGMKRIVGTTDLMRLIAGLGLRQGRDYLAFYDSTMARFWFENDAARRKIVDALKSVGDGDVLTDETLRDEGVYFEDGRYGQLVFLMRPGKLIVPSYMGARAAVGMHGFTPDDEDSDAILMSASEIDPAPTRIHDTYRAMLTSALGGPAIHGEEDDRPQQV